MANKQVSLVVKLKDQFSNSSKTLVRSIQGVNRVVGAFGRVTSGISKQVGDTSRRVRRSTSDITAFSAGLGLALGTAGRKIYSLEDTINEIVGRRFGKNDIFSEGLLTFDKSSFRDSVRNLVTQIDRELPRSAEQIAAAYSQLVQAGMTHSQVEAILPTSVRFAIGGNYGTEEAADKLTNVMTAMRVPMQTQAQAEKSAKRVSDVLAYAANITNSSIHQMTEAFKFAAPSAAALGIDVEQLAGIFTVMARSGIKASEAGVAIRSVLVRMVRPTKMGLAALQKAGIDPREYMDQKEPVTAKTLDHYLKANGMSLDGARSEVSKILTGGGHIGEQVSAITDALIRKGGGTAVDRQTISGVLREAFFSQSESLDIEKLIADMQAAKIPVSDFFKIFDVRQGARALTLFGADVSAVIERIRKNADGFTQALSSERMEGFVGAVQRFNSAIMRLYIALSESGVLDSITNLINGLVEWLDTLGKLNPEVLELGTYTAILLAAAAPLGFILAGLGTVFGVLGATLGFLLTPLGAVVGTLVVLASTNFSPILTFLEGFGAGVKDNLGPRTQNLIDAVHGKLQSFIEAGTMRDAAKARDGYEWGESIANWVEATIVNLENLWPRYEAWWNSVIAWRNGVAADLKSGFEWLHTDSDRWLGEQLSKIPGILSDTWGAIMNSEIVNNFSQAGAAILNGLKSIGTQLYSGGMEMIQSLWDGVQAKFKEFMDWLSTIPSQILGAIGSLDIGNLFGLSGSQPAPISSPIQHGSRLSPLQSPFPSGVVNKEGANVTFHNQFNVNGDPIAGLKGFVSQLEGQLNRSADLSFAGSNDYGDN